MKKYRSKDYADYGKKRLADSPFHNLKRVNHTEVLEKIKAGEYIDSTDFNHAAPRDNDDREIVKEGSD